MSFFISRLYLAVSYIIIPFLFIRLLLKSRKNPDYRKRFSERLGIYKDNNFKDNKKMIWIHCVSVGEFLATIPLINLLLKEEQLNIIITTTTPTGSKQVIKKYSNLKGRIKHVYLPFDNPILCNRFLNHFMPDMAVFIETEIWPNYLRELKKRDIYAYLINARLSEKSFNRYKKLGHLAKEIVILFSAIYCQNPESEKRFLELGANNVSCPGNIKFDINPSSDISKRLVIAKRMLNSKESILIASTHVKEEEIILDSIEPLINRFYKEDKLVIIAPRHPERTKDIESIIRKKGIKVSLFTQLRNTNKKIEEEQILIIDTLGELLSFYKLSSLAIIGGSFVNYGGHNPLEASLFKTPAIIGPFVRNFSYLIEEMAKNNSIVSLDDDWQKQIINNIQEILYTPKGQKIGENSYSFLEKNQGTSKKIADILIENIK